MSITCSRGRLKAPRDGNGAVFRPSNWRLSTRRRTPSTTRIKPAATYVQGEVLLAFLVFSDGQGRKRRPVLVVHDFGDDDLLVVPITSHEPRVANDVVLSDWKGAGLKLASTIRVEKLATIGKPCVQRNLGRLVAQDSAKFEQTLAAVFRQMLT